MMIERVARALCRHGGYSWDGPELVNGFESLEDHRFYWRVAAIVAIETMREPTERMSEAGRKNNIMRYTVDPAYSAMIDVALAD